MFNNAIAIGFALTSALTVAWGTVLRHRIAEDAPGDSPFLHAIRRPLWWLGTFTALAGYGLQIVALGFGSLLVVQPILVLSLMFTLPMAARYQGRRLSFSELFWATLLTVAVATLVLLGKPTAGNPLPSLSRWAPALAVGIIAMVAATRFAQRQIRNERALILGMVTGGIYGYVAVLSKATVDIFVHQGFFGLLTTWEGYSLIAGALIGTVVQQYAFNAGELKNSLPAMTIMEPIVAFALGYIVLEEKFQVTGWGWLFMAIALLVMILATIALSRRGIDMDA